MKLELYDNNHNLIDNLARYSDLSIESVLSTPDKILSFYYPKNLAGIIDYEGYIRTDTDEYVIKSKRDSEDNVSIQCRLNIEELEGNVFKSFDNGAIGLYACLNLALANSGWTIGSCPETSNKTMQLADVTNAWEIIKKCITTYGVEFKLDSLNKKVSAYNQIGVDQGVYFTDQLNLINLDTEGNSDDFYTGIKAYGKDNLSVSLENHQYSNKTKWYIWKDERYTDLTSLTTDARAKLDEISKPSVSYRCTIADLSKLNNYYGFLEYNLGDSVTIIDNVSKIKIKARIVRMVEYPDNPAKNTVDIGTNLIILERWFDNKFANYDYKLDQMDYNMDQLELDNLNLVQQVGNLDAIIKNSDANKGIYVVNVKTYKQITMGGEGYTTDWGDGTVDNNKSHTYAKEGLYTIKTSSPYLPEIDSALRDSLCKIIKIPETITDGSSRFKNFKNLISVGDILGIKYANNMFEGCNKLSHPANVRDLQTADYMYKDCTILSDTGKFPSTLTSAKGMFQNCINLIFTEKLNEGIIYADSMFLNCPLITFLYDLPSTLQTASYMYGGCSNLSNNGGIYEIPPNLIDGSYLFSGCSNFDSLVTFVKNNVLQKAEGMFYGCKKATSFDQIPSSLLTIKCMFNNCRNASFATLSTIPNGITDCEQAFQSCLNLKNSYAIPDSVINMDSMYNGSGITDVKPIGKNVITCQYVYANCSGITSIGSTVLQNSVTELNASRAFYQCINLLNATEIFANTKAEGVFEGCSKLTQMAEIHEGVTDAIELYSATGITNCNQYQLPNSLKYITDMFQSTPVTETINHIPTSCVNMSTMFNRCSSLTTIAQAFIDYIASNPSVAHLNVFADCPNITSPDTAVNLNTLYPNWGFGLISVD